MGTPAPPNEPASGCSLCFGEGRPLGPVQPKYLNVHIEGVEPGRQFGIVQGPLPNGDHRVPHDAGCTWVLRTPLYILFVNWSGNSSLVWWIDASSTFLFDQQVGGGNCRDFMENETRLGPEDVAFGGFARITYSEEGL